jgi:hypothetical protein
LMDAKGNILAASAKHGAPGHFAAEAEGRFYDELTGPNGATWEEYQTLWHKGHSGYLQYEPYDGK